MALFEALAIAWLKAASEEAVAGQMGLSWDEAMDHGAGRGTGLGAHHYRALAGQKFQHLEYGNQWLRVIRPSIRSAIRRRKKSGRANWSRLSPVSYGSRVEPIRYWSTARAALRPSVMAQTTSDCPRRISPAAKTPGAEDM